MVCGDTTTIHPKGPGILGMGPGNVVPHWWGGLVLGRRRGMLPHQGKVGGGEHDQEGLVPGARGLRGQALISGESFQLSNHM